MSVIGDLINPGAIKPTKTGMKKRRIASPDVCTSDLAVEACKQALKNANLLPKDIDLLILATSSPDVPLSSTAGIIQDKLGCVNCAAFDINAVCAGWVHALDIGSRFVGTSGYENVLVVGSEIYSRILNWKDRATCVLFGDGAGAAVLSKEKSGKGILGSWLMSDGSGSSVKKSACKTLLSSFSLIIKLLFSFFYLPRMLTTQVIPSIAG